ncbi:hypothetical protein [Leucobacter iarius]|uniref:Uncharacterized protein n=1 Tax=Leucobacter iarius TaxID=333963 RepID=A0ABP4XKB6_9MICO
MFQVWLWGGVAAFVALLVVLWTLQDLRERKERRLALRWSKAINWTSDPTAEIVLVGEVGEPGAPGETNEPGRADGSGRDRRQRVRLTAGKVAIDAVLDPPPAGHPQLEPDWYLLVSGWRGSVSEAKRNGEARIGAGRILDAFPPGTPQLYDRLSGRGERKPGVVARLLGFRGL